MAFQFVQMVEGLPATCYTDSFDDAVKNLGLTVTGVEKRTNLRSCLQGQPKVQGFVGPCYGGNVGGVDVIRYEEIAVYNGMSQ